MIVIFRTRMEAETEFSCKNSLDVLPFMQTKIIYLTIWLLLPLEKHQIPRREEVETAASIDYSPSRCNTCTQHIFLPLFCQSTGKKKPRGKWEWDFWQPTRQQPSHTCCFINTQPAPLFFGCWFMGRGKGIVVRRCSARAESNESIYGLETSPNWPFIGC